MNSVILTKNYNAPPLCEKEILRYAGCKQADEQTTRLLRECLDIARDAFTYKVCFCELPVKINGRLCDFGVFNLRSKGLAQNLAKFKKAVLFAATVGVEIDRLVAKYGRVSPAKALLLQAIGAERIEALCDAFCSDISKEYDIGLGPRFSPGYSDLPLACQKDVFAVLSPEKKIGLTLNDSLLMSPTKSVTAFMGLGGDKSARLNKCESCNKTDCTFRGV